MKKEYQGFVANWLALGAILVIAMVIIGGITRLTHSGLSMVHWKPISGIVPPLNETDWQLEFDHYKETPEFQKKNSHFELADFKSIFWWEFIHRALGRVIGIIFLVPFLFLLYKKVFDSIWIKRLLVLFLLGGLQGVIGWLMVKSGLVDQPAVSHYRLALHFCAALLVYSYILWLYLKIRPVIFTKSNESRLIYRSTYLLLIVLLLQIIFGAFVAGLKAGLIFNTWPLMGNEWMSSLVTSQFGSMGLMSLFEEPVTVQFIHRVLPFILLLPIVFLVYKQENNRLKTLSKWVLGIWVLQATLGVFTLLMRVPVVLGVVHQFVAVVLWTVALMHYFSLKTSNKIA